MPVYSILFNFIFLKRLSKKKLNLNLYIFRHIVPTTFETDPSAKIQLVRFLVISAIIRIKKQKRDSCPVSTSLYRPEPVSLDLSSVQFSRARGKLIKYENYNSPRRISRESVLDVEARSRIHIQTPNFIYSIISLAFHFATSTSARTRPCKLVFATLTRFPFFA